MNAVFDIMTVVVIGLSILIAVKKGLARSIIEFAGFLVSLFIAGMLSSSVGSWIYSIAVKPIFVGFATKKIGDIINTNATTTINSTDVNKIFDNAPQQLVDLSKQFGVSLDSVKQVATSKVSEGSAAVTKAIVDTIVTPLATRLSEVIAFILVFIVCLILVRIIAGLLDGIMNLPILGLFNKVGGAIFGVVRGVLLVCLLGTILTLLLPFIAPNQKPDDIINSTVTYKYVNQINPISNYFVTIVPKL